MTDATRSTRSYPSYDLALATVDRIIDQLQQLHLDAANYCLVDVAQREPLSAVLEALEELHHSTINLEVSLRNSAGQ